MFKKTHIPLATVAALMLLTVAALAKDPPRVDPARIPGSKARQLLLKQALEKNFSGTLVAQLNRYKSVYRSLTPQQLRDLRESVYGFLKENPDRQAEIIETAYDFLKLTPKQQKVYRERAAWLKKVVASLTPQQREELKRLSPQERSKRLLELKAKLVDTKPAPATTAPAE